MLLYHKYYFTTIFHKKIEIVFILFLSEYYLHFSSIKSAISLALFSITFISLPSIITLTNGSVPDGRISTLPLPENSFSTFSIADFISEFFS